MKPNITKKHAVGLAMMTNSFYDPDCGANLFKSSPIYQFNHRPTPNIVSAVKSGTLIDIVGNVLSEVEAVSNGDVNIKAIEDQVRANVEKELGAKHEAEIAKLKAEHEAEIAKLKAAIPAPAQKVEEVKTEENVEEVADDKEAKNSKKK